MAEHLQVEVSYALAERQWLIRLQLPAGSTVNDAVLASGLLQLAALTPPLDTGIYGKRVAADTCLCQGDRVEIYRNLNFDPMESRRRRAAKAQAGR